MIKRKQGVFGAAILLGGMVLIGCGTAAHPIAGAPTHHSHTVSPSPAASPLTSSTTPSSSSVTTLSSPTSSTSAQSPSTPASPSLSYVTYHNKIWGYSLAVPQTFTESGPVEDRDGRSWSSDSVNIAVYGEHRNALGSMETVASALSTLDHQKHPSYQAHGSDWLVVSGTHGSQIYYIKEFIGSTNMDVLSIAYPAIDKNHWSSMVSVVSRSFSLSPSQSTTWVFPLSDLEEIYATLSYRSVGPIFPPTAIQQAVRHWKYQVSLAMLPYVPQRDASLDATLIKAIQQYRGRIIPSNKTLVKVSSLPGWSFQRDQLPSGNRDFWWPSNNHWPTWITPIKQSL